MRAGQNYSDQGCERGSAVCVLDVTLITQVRSMDMNEVLSYSLACAMHRH